MKRMIVVLLIAVVLCGCSGAASYKEGREMADKTYGAMAPHQMMAASASILEQVKKDLDKAASKEKWWKGFCDRGEEIWLKRIDQINTEMGQKVLDPDQVKSMFDQMRSSFQP